MDTAELKAKVEDPEALAQQGFELLREIAHLYDAAEDARDEQARREARDLVIRCLEHREALRDAKPIHDALLVRSGLFPYLDDPDALSLGDRLAYESHRPLVEPRENFVFHRVQAEVYARLMDGETVILTAPTSFGKTLIVDALVVSGRYDNLAIVVPTIALIDEVRRRMSRLNSEHELGYRIITHPGQEQVERNIFVMTQERILEEENFPRLGIAVIDEMYKLSLDRDAERSALLNQALYKLRKLSPQLYLLGPNVGTLGELPADFEFHMLPSNDSTVAVDVIDVPQPGGEREALVSLCKRLDEPTLIFAKSPNRTSEVARWLLEAGISGGELPEAAEWLADNYHQDWALVHGLRAGVGIHHGRVPRAIAHYLVSAFNEERIRFLICTSTLIEGVNTTAKNIVVLDDTIDRRKYDLFTFKNIQGRSGRMFKHFVGKVFLFNPAPQDELPDIEIPVLSQSADAPVELLLAMDEGDLTETSRKRIERYLDQDFLPVSVLRTNSGVNLDAQLELAQELYEAPDRWAPFLSWTGFPEYEELKQTCYLLHEHFLGASARSWGVYSPDQLTFLISRASRGTTPDELITSQAEYWLPRDRTIDQVVVDVLGFLRNGLTFAFPKYLRALDVIQRAVMPRLGHATGDFSQFAAAAEGGFLTAPLSSLDEYGVPPQLARRLQNQLVPHGPESLDAVLRRLKDLMPEDLDLDDFERELLVEAKRDL